MGRPRRNDHRRDELLGEGLTQLMKAGYHGMGLKDLLKAVGVPKGSFYNYFESKETFTAEVIEHYSHKLAALFDAYLAATGLRGIEAMRGAYQLLIHAYESGQMPAGCLIGNLAGEVADESDVCRAAMASSLEIWRARFVEMIAESQQRGEVRSDIEAGQLVDFFWNAWEGSLLRAKVEGSVTPLRTCVAFLLDDFFAPRG
ncbi:MAG: TetR family transcriptional regulator C-terminal domain-containing protein [Myxococcales bacterium]|nr:TetR family transcriptional regulator C-terminal domain-containing protein [Myxococcales bacterium]